MDSLTKSQQTIRNDYCNILIDVSSPGDGVHGGDGLVLDDGAVGSRETRVVTQSRVQDGRVRVLSQLHELHVVEVRGRMVVTVRQQRGLLHSRPVWKTVTFILVQ